MSYVTAIALVGFVALFTYISRAGLVLALADRPLPAPVIRALRNVGPAVLAALVVVLVADPSQADRGVRIDELAGLAAGCVAAYFTRNMIASLAAGMIVFWVV